jgi:hypothetical protein
LFVCSFSLALFLILSPLVSVGKLAKWLVIHMYGMLVTKSWNYDLKVQIPLKISCISVSRVSYMIYIFRVGHELYSYNDSCRVESFNTLKWYVSWRHSWYPKISRLHMVPLNHEFEENNPIAKTA